MNIPRKLLLLLLPLLLVAGIFHAASAAEEGMKATWTPNESDDGAGPLPLSQQQRQQLWQLEQAIVQSPDPAATLQKAAAANDMDPNELAQLLERNHRDLEMAGAIPSSSSQQIQRPTNLLWKAMTGMAGLLWHAAVKHPRMTSWTSTVVLLLLYAFWVARPRTGLILSSRPRCGPITRGPTTLFLPPVSYLQQLLLLPSQDEDDSTMTSKNNWWRRMDNNRDNALLLDTWTRADQILPYPTDDGVSVHRPKQTLKMAVSFQTSIDLRDLLEDYSSTNDDDDDNTNDNAMLEDALQWSLDHAATLLSSRELTEWAETNKLRLVTRERTTNSYGDADAAILVVKKLGDWGRYGLVPLRVTHENIGEDNNNDDDNENDKLHLVLTTLNGAHFDGQIHVIISSQPVESVHEDDEHSKTTLLSPPSHLLYITVRLLVPKHRKCKAPSLAIATLICQQLSKSVATSLRLRTRQSLARAAQSHNYQQAARRRATERRHQRTMKQRALEEMAADRRRRWQRSHPNSGSYRPSGDRMRSPNHAVYK